MNNDHEDAMQEQRILKILKKDYALVKRQVDETRKVSRSIVVGRIVCFMRRRHQIGNNTAIGLHDMLTGSDQQFVNWDTRYWLYTTGIPEHPKIITLYGGLQFVYRPKYNINNRFELMSLLKKAYDDNEDGIPLDDILESLPNAEEIIESNSNDIVTLTRLTDKKKVLFHAKKADDLERLDKDIQISAIYAVPRKYNTLPFSNVLSSFKGPMKLGSDFQSQSGSGDSDGTLLFDNIESSSDTMDWKGDTSTDADSVGPSKSNTVEEASGTADLSPLVCEPDVMSNEVDDIGADKMDSS